LKNMTMESTLPYYLFCKVVWLAIYFNLVIKTDFLGFGWMNGCMSEQGCVSKMYSKKWLQQSKIILKIVLRIAIKG
jgi:hypothetical protein